jgi:hypothetical protein
MKKYLYVLLAAGTLSACTTLPAQEGGETAEAKEYVTGSMLPQRNNGAKVEKLTKSQIEDFQRSSNNALGTVGK